MKAHLEPLYIEELVAHMNYSMEMDDRHAAMALRAHWPKLRGEILLRLDEEAKRASLQGCKG